MAHPVTLSCFGEPILGPSLYRQRGELQFLPKLTDLPLFERVHSQPLPSLRNSDQCRKGQLQATLLIKEPGNHLAPPSLLLKSPLQKVRGPDRLAMSDRTAQVIQTGLQIFSKSLHRRWVSALILLNQFGCHLLGCLKGRRMVDRIDMSFDLWDRLSGDLGQNVSFLVHQ